LRTFVVSTGAFISFHLNIVCCMQCNCLLARSLAWFDYVSYFTI